MDLVTWEYLIGHFGVLALARFPRWLSSTRFLARNGSFERLHRRRLTVLEHRAWLAARARAGDRRAVRRAADLVRRARQAKAIDGGSALVPGFDQRPVHV